MAKLQVLLKLIRLKHWVKNVVIFSPVFFAGKITGIDKNDLFSLCLTFIVFSLTSSLIYILNDLKDVEKDRLHPEKSKRPIASNAVTPKQALIIFFIILVIDIGLLLYLKSNVAIAIISYFVLNISYVYYIKNISVIDITSISLGFVLRIIAGGFAVDVAISHWIVITIFLLMFSVGLAKRKDDLYLNKGGDQILRGSQKGYNLQFIDIGMSISFGITIMTYILYTVSQDVIQRVGSEYIYITSLPVFLGVLRYLQLAIVEQRTGSPVKLILSDKWLKGIVFVWISIFYFILYV